MPPNNSSSLPAGDKLPQLKTGDDLAIEALSQSGQGQAAGAPTIAIDEAKQSDDFAQTLHALESIIESKANKVMQLKQKSREKKEMLNNVFENDPAYQEAQAAREEATQQYKQRQSALNETAQVRQLREETREIRDEIKEIEESLSNHLINYHQLTNSTSFDTSEGDQWEFQIKARVKNKQV